MKLGIDTNVLVSAHMPGLEDHEPVRSFLLDHLGQPDVRLVLTPLVLHEWVHVVTDQRRFEPPVEMGAALQIANGYLRRPNVQCLPVDEPSFSVALDLLARHRLGRRRIADTLFAATLLTHGVHRLVTLDRKDFSVFEDIELIDPR